VRASRETISYGLYQNSEIELPIGTDFKVHYRGAKKSLTLHGALGKLHVSAALSAVAVGIAEDISIEKIAAALEEYSSPRGRMKLLPAIRDAVIIDDTYASAPLTVQEGLKTLKSIKNTGRSIAVLGDMLHLGDTSIELHRKMGVVAAKSADMLVTVGVRSRATADAALDAGFGDDNILQFETAREAGLYLSEHMLPRDIFYVKGSPDMRMERVVEELMLDREHKERYLVRQGR
jgi:UDP-N-acetylmuramoyl-tripeptide--D-alanyl-D-alanine ligase